MDPNGLLHKIKMIVSGSKDLSITLHVDFSKTPLIIKEK